MLKDNNNLFKVSIEFNKDAYNNYDKDVEALDIVKSIENHINEVLENNINYVIFTHGFSGYDLESYEYNINDINHALNILIDYDYFDIFETVRIYNYNTGYLYRDIKGGL